MGKRDCVKVFILFAGIILWTFSCHTDQSSGRNAVSDTLKAQADSFLSFLVNDFMPSVLQADSSEEEKLQHQFLQSRLLFKKFEWAAEYFLGGTTDLINGPPDQEVENAELMDPSDIYALDPSGLQIIEEYLFPHFNPAKKKDLEKEVEELIKNTKVYTLYFEGRSFQDWRILDALKMEIFRIMTLSLAGFDNPLTLRSAEESATSLQSMKEVLSHYEDSDSLVHKIDAAVSYLSGQTDFDAIDRAEFILEFGNPISSGIADIEARFGYPIKYNRMLKQEARTLFDSNAFNINAFVPGPEFYYSEEKANLGKVLFFDASLSGTGTRSCATCHNPGTGFTDGLSKQTNIHDDTKLIRRHTPTLLNVALQSNYFFDMRALTLEDQANDVIHNPEEMDGNMQDIIQYLSGQSTYKTLFEEAFPNRQEPIDSMNILNALASYERSLTYLNSRFDQYMRGDKKALLDEEVRGFNLFMGKAKCATCHFLPVFNGIAPPKYVQSETEVIGVPTSETDSTLDADRGYYDIIGVESYKYAFKTTTVRNASLTAPYMHNGIHQNLEDLMEFYNNAGAIGLGIDLPNMTLPEDSLHLTTHEQEDIIAFINSLESEF